jgi:hypothetical protein
MFNKLWARRVLVRARILLLITDGLDRDVDDTPPDMDRLHRFCRRLAGSIRCCASMASRRAPAASRPCCRMTNFVRSTPDSIADLVASLRVGGGRGPKA